MLPLWSAWCPRYAGTEAIRTDSLSRAWHSQQHRSSEYSGSAAGTPMSRTTCRRRPSCASGSTVCWHVGAGWATPGGPRDEDDEGAPLQRTGGGLGRRPALRGGRPSDQTRSVEEFETLGGSESVSFATTWDGRFHGLTQDDLRTLLAVGEFRAEPARRS